MRSIRNAAYGLMLVSAAQFGWTVNATTVSVAATDPTATIGSSDNASVTFTRSDVGTSPLSVNFSLGGSAVKWIDYRRPEGDMPVTATIPAGALSATMNIAGITNCTQAAPLNVTFTLAPDAAYTVGALNSTAVAIVDASVVTPPVTNIPPVTNPPPVNPPSTNSYVPNHTIDDTTLAMPKAGDNALRIISPTLLEVCRINTKSADPGRVDSWDFVNAANQLQLPAVAQFSVTVNGQSVTVQSVGFKRRPLYAPLNNRDLRIANCIYLQLATPISDNQTVVVTNPNGTLWPVAMTFSATADPLRYGPAIHVNQEGYVPSFPKKAAVGYYLGSMGEMNISSSLGFKIVNAATGTQVYQGTLTSRPDVGYTYSPTPYQKVLEADFSAFTTPGEYQLVVPGLGASLPFMIDEGVAMAFARAYELGLYHQRCGTDNSLPYSRFTHDACHTAAASVPTSQSSFAFTWNTIAMYANQASSDNPPQIAPLLTSPSAQLYPFVRTGTLDTSGGHHDAGDYSKYTINCASLTHSLMFSADSLAGVGALDNLGIPESGDGISDIMQEAKWEADYLAKIQDTDGGFYFLCYPREREYESGTQPDHGDPQVVWPKTTSVTAAAVAALAQCASSPSFKQKYPQVAAQYLQKAQLGWQFLTNAIARYGKDGAYQKITHYGDDFMHNDELAWAACEMFLATGGAAYHQKLMEWFPDPSNPATFRWGWWRMYACYGNAVRSYAFAARSGRLPVSQLNAAYLAKCEAQVTAAGNDALTWSQQGAYGSSFPDATKRVRAAGWYFSADQAFDIAVAQQITPRAEYLDAMVRNMNYEGGGNPVNMSYVCGLGWKRQREIVHQYAQSDRRVLPQTGIPLASVQNGFVWVYTYGTELNALCYPTDDASTSPYPFYDRWGDAFNTTTEFVVVNQGRGLGTMAYLAALTATKSQTWKSANATITTPSSTVAVGQPTTITLQVPGMDLSGARVIWEGRDQEPSFGSSFTFTPVNNGAQWVEAEAQWPDGRRVVAAASFTANSPNVVWVDNAPPAGAQLSSSGGDSWNWVSSSPTPYSGSTAHQSAIGAGLHEHWFDWATATMDVGTGDTLYAYVYLDPANTPSEIMLGWNDGSWEHRAYWGANNITYGNSGTAGRRYMGPLPPPGQWVRLEVPASQVGLEGSTLRGMDFAVYGGRATWDLVGKTSVVGSGGGGTGVVVGGNTIRATLLKLGNSMRLSWPSIAGKNYRIAYKNDLSDSTWTDLNSSLTATGTTTSLMDTTAATTDKRFYVVFVLN